MPDNRPERRLRGRFVIAVAIAVLAIAPIVSLIAYAWHWGPFTAFLYSILLSAGVSLIILNWGR